ncbi:hypothetical protein [Myroides odoratimimus]|uniref:hypothetical protein n=1 Tax=Myroides odoratimimus TaxID=76832 RepID=UPI002578CE65|nr:hypothetical protein [Myroides odoratimimus]MDM1528280.1 hypothetical protein [Myroides odoratimimus]
MKIKKVLSLFAITAFLLTSCSSDDNEIIRPEQKDQVEVSKESPVLGDYSFNHAGNPIPFHFEKTTITMKMSGMAGSGQDDEIFNVITTYKNAEGVLKTVAKNKDNNEYKAFFFRDIKDDKSTFLLNTDLSASSEIEAIKAAYPAKDIIVDHGAGQFGWLPMTQGAIVEKIKLPISGLYIFEDQGHKYTYTFSDEVVNFDSGFSAYDMTVLAHNKNTNKILLEGKDESVKGRFYVMQLQNIKGKLVEIGRTTYLSTEKEKAKKEFASSAKLKDNKGEKEVTFNRYQKDTNAIFGVLDGTYTTETINNGFGYYKFTVGQGDDAFIMIGNFSEDPNAEMKEGGRATLKKVFTNEKEGQIIYEITKGEGYYARRVGYFLTIYVKDIAEDGSKATYAIATKDGGNTILGQGEPIAKTKEEAIKIKAPSADKIFDPKEGMMKYAHLWIPTTRE